MPTPEQLWMGCAMLVVAIWGGAVSYYRRVSKGLAHTWLRLVGELGTSAMAGLGVGILCYDAGFSLPWSVAFAGVAGHMGSAVFDMGEEILRNAMFTMAGKDRRDGDRRSGVDRRDP